MYKCRAVAESSSLDTAPVTRSLLFATPIRHLTVSQAAGFRLCVLIECNNCFRVAVCQALRFPQRLRVDFVMATGSDTPAGARSGMTFDVTFEVPWNTPKTYIQLHSEGVFELEKTVPDVLGLCGRRLDAAVIRVMQGCDARSVCALIPDPRVLERGFHDVTIVDMEDTAEPAVSEADLSLLWRQCSLTEVQSMTWLQNELDDMCAAAEKRYRHSQPGDCSYCGKWINVACIAMCRLFTWIWDSCGVAWCRGALCGRARHRTVWTTSVGNTMCLRTKNLQLSTISFRPGRLGIRFGLMPLNHAIREFRLMFSSSVG